MEKHILSRLLQAHFRFVFHNVAMAAASSSGDAGGDKGKAGPISPWSTRIGEAAWPWRSNNQWWLGMWAWTHDSIRLLHTGLNAQEGEMVDCNTAMENLRVEFQDLKMEVSSLRLEVARLKRKLGER